MYLKIQQNIIKRCNIMFICEFCSKELSTKTTLKTHQEKAKFCLEKQNKVIQPEIKCGYCNKMFMHKHRKETHEIKCKVRIENERLLELSTLRDENIRLKQEVETLKIDKEKQRAEIYSGLFKDDQHFILEQSKRLVEKSGTTTNIRGKNIIMNTLNLSHERMLAIKDTYTMKHYEMGGIGQADWANDNILRDEEGNLIYLCTDKNRRNFIYRDDKGNIITDIHAKKLKEAILPMIMMKIKEYRAEKYNSLADISDDESELLEKYSTLYRENKELGSEFEKRLVEKTYV